MKQLIATVAIAMGMAGCGLTAQQVATVVVNVSTDVCTFISQDDPTAPTSVQVVCKVEGQVAPVVVNLPWATWQQMLTQPTGHLRAVQLKARAKSCK